MKISFHTGGLFYKPFPEVVEHLAKVGYDGVEVVVGPGTHADPANLSQAAERQAIKALVTEHGMAFSAVNPYRMGGLADMERKGEAQAYWRQLIDLAAEWGAPTVHFLAGGTENDTESWKNLIQALKRLAPHAEAKGVTLSIHNHEATLIDMPEKVLLLAEWVGSPAIKLNFDATNFHILRVDVRAAVKMLAPYIVHVHLKGVRGMYPYNQFLVPGEEDDQFDFPALAATLGEIGYQGFISVETFLWMPENKAEVAYRMVSDQLAELGLRSP